MTELEIICPYCKEDNTIETTGPLADGECWVERCARCSRSYSVTAIVSTAFRTECVHGHQFEEHRRDKRLLECARCGYLEEKVAHAPIIHVDL